MTAGLARLPFAFSSVLDYVEYDQLGERQTVLRFETSCVGFAFSLETRLGGAVRINTPQ
jgi:hypothetical protein